MLIQMQQISYSTRSQLLPEFIEMSVAIASRISSMDGNALSRYLRSCISTFPDPLYLNSCICKSSYSLFALNKSNYRPLTPLGIRQARGKILIRNLLFGDREIFAQWNLSSELNSRIKLFMFNNTFEFVHLSLSICLIPPVDQRYSSQFQSCQIHPLSPNLVYSALRRD